MKYDIDYEIEKYIDEQTDMYTELEKLLKYNNLTYDEAERRMKKFRENFKQLLLEYNIESYNLVMTCYELIDNIIAQPNNSDLRYIYFCIMTDSGLLNTPECQGEQAIRNYIRQAQSIRELINFFNVQEKICRKFYKLIKYLKKTIIIKNINCSDECNLIYQLTIRHTFLHDCVGNNIYMDNLNELLIHINSDEELKSVKPYVIFAVLTRKHGMM